MTLLEAHALIVRAAALGIVELVTEAVENHKSEMVKRGRKATQNYGWAYMGIQGGQLMAKVKLEDTMVSEYITVTVNGYQGEVNIKTGSIGAIQTGKGARMPDATELRRYAEFILELAKTSERLKQEAN